MSTDNKDGNWLDDFVFRISTAQNDTAITGASGKTANIDIVNYDEFGNQNNGKVQTASDNPYGYRGYYQDVESGMGIYQRATLFGKKLSHWNVNKE
jgi:hypothetical protein